MFDRAPKKSALKRIASQLTDIKPEECGETTMHDVNIEKMMKLKIYFQFGRIGHILKSSMLNQ